MAKAKTDAIHYTVPARVTRNLHKVPKKQWAKWSPIGRCVFNQLYATARDNQSIFLWPGDQPRTARRWKTTCWNVAWLAADYASEA